MYLKSIEVQGFKSFANKIKFEFHNGVTCIVGPNGSGKSNVSDAVRWVFGEQSAKQLRSSNMQDVIFAGTQLRKPQSYAEVTITLDNMDRAIQMDTDEVSVTRKVYRSGDSEYRLNGNLCRLKDIMELFYDTGIGKEGYSIIGQGQVEKILSGKAEERRELFDEACGIVKYKKRKNQAMKKLESEQANMLRLTDILSELERQVGPLKRQSENAKEYLKLKDELKAYDINAFLLDESTLNAGLKKIAESLEITNNQLSEKQDEERVLRQNYVDVDDELHTLEWKIDQQRGRVSEADQEKNEIQNNIALDEEKINSEQSSKEHFLTRIEEILKAQGDQSQKNEADQKGIEEIEQEIKETEASLNEKNLEIEKKNTEIQLYQSQVDESHLKVIDILNEKSEAHAEFERLGETISQSQIRISEYEDTLKNLKASSEDSQKNSEEIKTEIQGIQQEIEDKNNELKEVQADYQEAGDDYYKTQTELNDLQAKLQISKGRIESLKSIVERYEGFNPAVKRVMEFKSTNKAIRGTVSDLISVDRKYQTLIETALGGNFQNIIIDSEEKAKEMVRFLKENKAGRATFLPLDAIKASGGITDTRILKEKGVIGTADTLVSAEPVYREAVKYLLERFLAVDTIDNALQIARKYHYTTRIVTLEGEFLNVGGSISGGAFKSSNNVLSRNDELQDLEKNVEVYKTDIEKLQKRMNQVRQIRDSYSGDIEELQDEIHALELKFAELKAKYDSYARSLSFNQMEQQEVSAKLSEAKELLASSKAKKEAIDLAVKNLESMNSESSDSANKVKDVLSQANEQLNALLAEKEAISVKISELVSKKDAIGNQMDERNDSILRYAEEKRLSEEKIAEAEENVKTLEAEIVGLKEKLENFGDYDKTLGDTLKLLVEQKEKLTTSQRDFFEKRDSISKIVADLQKEVFRLESQQEKAEEKLENLTEYLWNEYELTPSEAEKYKDLGLEGETPQDIRRKAHELKASIKALGNINVNAIEEYKEVSERYEFLNGQYQDLKTAEESLLGIIDELNDGMRKQFREQFELIQGEFNIVFKELFGGGSGSIELNPDVDCIESDIAIISQPPGKKLQNMMQLSGGEKALTAIALIFAIQKLKPSPFCLLDEIEAALDDSNVVRFTNYVKKLTDRTQYIIITHRRGTMVSADRLYGITMQEKGVSALVSVNLVEKDLDA